MSSYFWAILIISTIYAVYMILRAFGVFDFARETSKVVDTVKYERTSRKKRRAEAKRLALYTEVINLFRGLLMTDLQYENHLYWIQRLELRSKVLNRHYTPEEYRGRYALIFIIGLFFIPLGVLFRPFLIVTLITSVLFFGYPLSLKQRIEQEDIVIDNNFLNLYLLLYSRLKMGSRARLQSVVESYIETMQAEGDAEVREVMTKFARFMLNNLAQFEDHVAIPKLRDRYKSATIINFCNVVGQALQGVDNSDNLLTFKMQLIEHKTNIMKKRCERIYAAGTRSIYLIWVILFIFIAVGWYSKLPFQYM